jgi:hypothetical protein
MWLVAGQHQKLLEHRMNSAIAKYSTSRHRPHIGNQN